MANLTETKKNHQHWIKAFLCIGIFRNGITCLVFNALAALHKKLLSDICQRLSLPDAKCTSCTTANCLPCPTDGTCTIIGNDEDKTCNYHVKGDILKEHRDCPNGICNILAKNIASHHRYNSPVWQNTDATKWCIDPWEIAKCFLPRLGYADKTSLSGTDLISVINLIINCLDVQSHFDACIEPPNGIFPQILVHVTKILQKDKLCITKFSLDEFVDLMISVLQDKKELAQDHIAKEQVVKLSQLKDDSEEIKPWEGAKAANDTSQQEDSSKGSQPEEENPLSPPCYSSKGIDNSEVLQKQELEEPALNLNKKGDLYTITVKTGQRKNAITDANVSITFYGKEKLHYKTEPIFPTKKCKGDESYMFSTDIPFEVTCVEVGHDNTGESPDWFCEYVTILCDDTHLEQVFTCKKWLSKSKGDGMIKRLLYENKVINNEELHAMCRLHGRKSQKVAEACKRIRLEILACSVTFKEVWPTYKPSAPDDIVFVVFRKPGSDSSIKLSSSLSSFVILYRNIGEYCNEDKDIPRGNQFFF